MVVKESAVLLVTDAVALSGTVVSWALQAFEDKVVAGKSLAIVTQASSLGIVGKLEANSSSYDAIISLARTPGYHSSGCLVELAQMLKPGGILVVQEPLDMTANEVVGETVTMSCQTEASLKRNILFAGLIEAETKEALENILPAAAFGSPGLQSIMISSKKPVWETGSSFTIKKKEMKKPAASNGTTVRLSFDETISVEARGIVLPNTNGTLDLKDLGFDNDDDEFIDEDALLTEEDLRRPELPKDDDCEVGNAGRKACKNCTCGRAELEEKAELTTDMLANPQSACGNCGLGDAFRCNGCPYRGLPPFKIGEKISLSEAFLTADV